MKQYSMYETQKLSLLLEPPTPKTDSFCCLTGALLVKLEKQLFQIRWARGLGITFNKHQLVYPKHCVVVLEVFLNFSKMTPPGLSITCDTLKTIKSDFKNSREKD